MTDLMANIHHSCLATRPQPHRKGIYVFVTTPIWEYGMLSLAHIIIILHFGLTLRFTVLLIHVFF